MYMRNKDPKTEPCGKRYLIVLIIDGSVLSSVAEIAFKPMKDPPLISYDLVSKERYYD